MPELNDQERREERAESNAVRLETFLGGDGFLEHLRQILPAHLETDRFATIALRHVRAVPDLKLCTMESIAASVMTAGSLGLEIATQGESWLIPRYEQIPGAPKGEKEWIASLQVGYLGHLALAWRSDKIADVQVDVVCAGDPFEFQRGTEGYLHHKPRKNREVSEKTIEWAYAVVRTTTGGVVWGVLDHAQIERLRNTGASANSPAWRNWYDQMAMGKVLKRTLKFCPRSREMGRAITIDDQLDANVRQDLTIDLPALPREASLSEAEKAMRAAAAKQAGPARQDEPAQAEAEQREPEPVPAQRAEQPAPQGDGESQPGDLGF